MHVKGLVFVGTFTPARRQMSAFVEDVLDELRERGISTDTEISGNDRQRYVHFRAPDGRLYELVEDIRQR